MLTQDPKISSREPAEALVADTGEAEAPPEDIPDPGVPDIMHDVLRDPHAHFGEHEALLVGFCAAVQARLRAWLDEEHAALRSHRGVIDLEHQRLCQSLEAVTKLAQHAVTTAGQANEHAQYQLSDALVKFQEHGLGLRTDPYQVQVQAMSPKGFPVTFTIGKATHEELLQAGGILIGWLTEQHFAAPDTTRTLG